MAPKLYYTDASPPVRGVLLTAKALGLEMELKPVNLFAGEHMSPEYVKMNPQHTVPTLDDNGYILWDSHAICCYLVGKYGKDDSLYPKDLQIRGTIDQRLHFNSNVLQIRLGAIVGPILRQGEKTIPEEKANNVVLAYDMLEIFLEGHNYFVGDHLTIADLCLAATLSTASVFVPFDKEKHSRLVAWLSRMQALPYYQEANQTGSDKLVGFLKSKLA